MPLEWLPVDVAVGCVTVPTVPPSDRGRDPPQEPPAGNGPCQARTQEHAFIGAAPRCCGGYRHYGRAASYSPGRPWSLDGAALANKVYEV